MADAEVSIHQVLELMSGEVLEKSGAKAARAAFAHIPVATVEQLAQADAIIFGTPYGATAMAKGDGSRQPGENELAIARFQGRHVTQIAAKLAAKWLGWLAAAPGGRQTESLVIDLARSTGSADIPGTLIAQSKGN